MAQSPLRLIKRCTEFRAQADLEELPGYLRGIYVLYRLQRRNGRERYSVVYVGMSAAGRRRGIRWRLHKHQRAKGELWTHFSVYEVWDNIRDDEIRELEGLFRHIYRKDPEANRLNVARGFKAVRAIRANDLSTWT
jgi:hypothetical protein